MTTKNRDAPRESQRHVDSTISRQCATNIEEYNPFRESQSPVWKMSIDGERAVDYV